MPLRELKNGKQVADWLAELGASSKAPGRMTLIGSAALLWHLQLSVPAPTDLLAPKLRRNEPRDQAHAEWAKRIGLLE